MKKVYLLLFVSFMILSSCEKNDEEEKTCKISFTYSNGQIIASGCSSVTYSNIVYDALGNPFSFDYSGCGETGSGTIFAGSIGSSCD